MIEIAAVQPTVQELRPLSRGWGALHWMTVLPAVVLIVGLIALQLVILGLRPDDGALQAVVTIIVMVAILIWWIAQASLYRLTAAATLKAPSAGRANTWILDDGGVVFHTPSSSSWMDWALVKDVIEERDRFVLLVSPHNNLVLPKRQLSGDQLSAITALVAEIRASGLLGRGVD